MRISKQDLEKIAGKRLEFSEKRGGILLATSLEDASLGDETQGIEGSPYEWFQIFDPNDNPYSVDGKIVVLYRAECHGPTRIDSIYHRAADAWVVNQNGELLVSVRSELKDLYPGKGDNSVSEHNKVGESYLDAMIRGFNEELGMQVGQEDLSLVMKLPIMDGHQWQMSQYYVLFDKKNKFKPSVEEIDSIRWASLEDLKKNGIRQLNFRPDHATALKYFIENYKPLVK